MQVKAFKPYWHEPEKEQRNTASDELLKYQQELLDEILEARQEELQVKNQELRKQQQRRKKICSKVS